MKHTGPLPVFETHLTPPDFPALSNDDKNLRDAFMMLDINAEYEMSRKGLIGELKFNFGYTTEQAEHVYEQWEKMKA